MLIHQRWAALARQKQAVIKLVWSNIRPFFNQIHENLLSMRAKFLYADLVREDNHASKDSAGTYQRAAR